MNRGDPRNPWDVFWEREQVRSGIAQPQQSNSGEWQAMTHASANVWKDFARSLPRNARVLDLATGNGMVLNHMQSVRRDLKLTGIDRAAIGTEQPRGIRLLGEMRMERLRLPDGRFAAVTSQYGFEYGNMELIAAQIARVLHPAGRVALLTHRIDGQIVAHNRKRREQIVWAIDEQDLVTKANNSLALRSAGVAVLPKDIVEAPEKGAALHGPQSAAWEIAEAVRRTLHMGRQDSAASVMSILDNIQAQAQNELGRIASLEQAAENASAADAIEDAMSAAGMTMIGHRSINDDRIPSPFADFRTFKLQSE